jgi:hypothetical protein
MAAKTSSILSGKVAGVPKPVVLLVVAVAAFFLLRRFNSAGSTTSSSAGTNATPTSADNTQYPSTPSDGTGGGAPGVQAPDLSALLDALQSGLQNPATGETSTYNYSYYNSTTPGTSQAGGGNVGPDQTGSTSTQSTTSYTPQGQIANLSNVQRQALDLVNAGVPITGTTAGGQMFTVPTLTATNLQNAAVRSDLGKAVGNVTPVSVKATPNKTGVSANAKQGVFAIH